MIFRPTRLGGAVVIELERQADERGFFARAFCEREFAEHGLPTRFPQCNLSCNVHASTLRGMHYQAAPHAEGKLVRCIAGTIFDVIVDLRPASPTRYEWLGVALSAESGRALFVPKGFAHGFVTLSGGANVFYHMDESYVPGVARGFRWNDPRFGIEWPVAPAVITERDATYADFDPRDFDGMFDGASDG
jgi:dTDP-4-dehydrorhamnose 3,5-epimerase